jgi:hypothetical protein
VAVLARRPCLRAPPRLSLAVLCGVALALFEPISVGAQNGPIQLFPKREPVQPGAPQTGPRPPSGTPAPAPPSGPPSGGSATTAAPQGFQVEGLAPPEIDSIGLSGPAEGGFERTLWAGSDPQLVLALLPELPVTSANPPLRELIRRLLATGAPLDGGPTGGRMLGARVERLLAMGDLDTAKRLLDQLPPERGDSQLARLAAQAALLEGDDPGACQRANDLAPTGGTAFWAEIAIYCRLAAGDEEGARLGLDLLREAGHADPGFFRLAGAVANHQADGAGPAMRSPAAVDVALLRLAGQSLPATSLGNLPPAVLTVAAREPKLARDRQLEIAERAFEGGGLAASDLGAIYGERAPAGDALTSVRTAWGPQARAMAYRAAGEQRSPQDLAALMAATWQAARGDERLMIAEVFATRFGDLPVDRSLLAAGPGAARALLTTDRPAPAAGWLALLKDEGSRDSRVQREVAALAPLYAITGIGGGAAPELDEAAVAAWRAATPDADAKAERLFALLDGLGSPVPGPVWWHELRPPLQQDASVPVAALWAGLERAAAARRLGETVLFALTMLNGAPAATEPEVLTACLRGLRSVGLDHEARQIAVATALAMGL